MAKLSLDQVVGVDADCIKLSPGFKPHRDEFFSCEKKDYIVIKLTLDDFKKLTRRHKIKFSEEINGYVYSVYSVERDEKDVWELTSIKKIAKQIFERYARLFEENDEDLRSYLS